ncbi:acyl carrier protein [Achromobacter xylosoxidans]|jgi:acyl carrier protein|uniref:Acyl carrier protein n=2 Tax=Alcaligenes xylosoxydans xylosoxydans TaxID=85698 RepID=A0A0D6H6S3_ALCXX|nr:MULTISPECIES: acyl carrier protein [Achromobacter]AHC46619.1 Acyl carrier protein (ACP2) [Achromobacter xylosoxidans NBRC 15126 = ATCC 27061]AMH06721.1 acyl carrier protein [Achromobacter xylosoxidans]AXA76829.1 acyl carrier protein [Achromobacter xylosoxidans]EFV87106.1 acyl carrier protein [Achromobacter xylosoxidans C54]KOQ23721.1 acyl carrier protein [Achromobacter xylosoxidans]
MQTREEIYNTLRDTLNELFEVELERITPQANLYTDLQIDSIDAIDLIDQVRRKTGRKLDANDFRSVRTVDDVVQAMYQKQQQDADA